MKYVLFYESEDEVRSKAPRHFDAHRAHWAAFQADGSLLMIGTFGNVQDEGSMGIFTTRQAAEAFARNDPFVLNSVVRRWFVRDWHEALTEP